jgi:hypothetical protein
MAAMLLITWQSYTSQSKVPCKSTWALSLIMHSFRIEDDLSPPVSLAVVSIPHDENPCAPIQANAV